MVVLRLFIFSEAFPDESNMNQEDRSDMGRKDPETDCESSDEDLADLRTEEDKEVLAYFKEGKVPSVARLGGPSEDWTDQTLSTIAYKNILTFLSLISRPLDFVG